MNVDDLLEGLPGETVVRQGLADLRQGPHTNPACLVGVARTRLSRAGLDPGAPLSTSNPPLDAELERYQLLGKEPGDAYSRYHALLRELVSFENALDRRLSRANAGGKA